MSDWKDVLGRTPECIDVERFGSELDAQSREHLDACVHCQAELALYREITRAESTAGEDRVAREIAETLQRSKVVEFRPRPLRVLYAVAAAFVLIVGIGWWMQLREPSLDPIGRDDVYRSTRVELIAPRGELDHAPNELRWTAVPNASRYRVEITEVDDTVVWSSDTAVPRVALPADVIAKFVPGKSLTWEVKAFRGEEMLASSETQLVRVSVAPSGNPQ